MQHWQGDEPSIFRGRKRWWGSGVVIWCLLCMYYMPARDSESASRTHQRLAQQSAPAVSPPPALPLSATERVLELSLEQAIHLALQNNLDIERGRLDPQVAHTQTEQARAVYDPSVGLTTSLSQLKTLPQNKTVNIDQETGQTSVSITRPFSKDV